MGFFARAVVSGFAFSLGKALFDKVKDHIGLGDTPSTSPNGVTEIEDIDADVDDEGTRRPAVDLESLGRAAN
jgi:hypothetical protein